MRWIILLLATLGLSACATMSVGVANHFRKVGEATGDAPYAAPPIREVRKTGNPYVIDGVRYYPMNLRDAEGFRERGIASWYGHPFHGRKTANGEKYNMHRISAAHKTLPLPTWVRVTNLENGRSLVLRVNDRGPFKPGRVIDLSVGAAKALGTYEAGLAPVLVEALPADGSALPRAPREIKTVKQAEPVQRAAAAQPHTSFTERVSQMTAEEETLPPTSALTQRATQRHDTVAPKLNEHTFDSVHIYVQAGAFGDVSNAQNLQAELNQRFTYPTLLQPVVVTGRTLTRVRVGPFTSVEAADAALTQLVTAGYSTAIIALEDK